MNFSITNFVRWMTAIAVLTSLSACSNGNSSDSVDSRSSTGAFFLADVADLNLIEGNPAGANISVVVERSDGHSKPIELSISGARDVDDHLITFGLFPEQLGEGQNTGSVNINLAIDDLPIMPQQRSFYIDATDGVDSARTTVVVNVQPTTAPDIYLLAGQSNMVGFSGEGTKDASAGGPDEPHPRIFQLNVSENNQYTVFTTDAAFSTDSTNVIDAARIITAEDPLHVPLDPSVTTNKSHSYIGMGMSFAKAALNNTTQNIILVPAAWSGSAFCTNDEGPSGQWNAQPTTKPHLGNTLLFDRAVTRANIAIAETGGILRGILWHQGESDANNSACSLDYQANLERLAQQFRLQINADLRGGDLRRADANIPFVVGTMSRGIDERGDLSEFWPDKQLIDNAHKILPSKISHAAVTNNDDLIPANGYPCGNTTCIHYGAIAFREMGVRYYESLLRAAANP